MVLFQLKVISYTTAISTCLHSLRTCRPSWSGRWSSPLRYRGSCPSKGRGPTSTCTLREEWWETVVSCTRYELSLLEWMQRNKESLNVAYLCWNSPRFGNCFVFRVCQKWSRPLLWCKLNSFPQNRPHCFLCYSFLLSALVPTRINLEYFFRMPWDCVLLLMLFLSVNPLTSAELEDHVICYRASSNGSPVTTRHSVSLSCSVYK